MESPNRQQELLRMYVERTLTGDDLAEFRHLAQTDPAFRREAEVERRISQAVQKAREEKLRQKLNRIHEEVTAEQAEPVGRVIQRFGRSLPMKWAAAVAIALLVISAVVWKITQSDETEQMAQGQQITVPQDEITTTLGLAGSDTVKTTTEIPVVLYESTADRPQYSFQADTLRLYGSFQRDSLRLIVRRPTDGPETYQLRNDGTLYDLNRQVTEPTSLTK